MKTSFLTLLILYGCCNQPAGIGQSLDSQASDESAKPVEKAYVPPSVGKDISSRFPPPAGAQRVVLDSTSFGHFLRHLPLKPSGTRVKYYDGREKNANGIYCGVVDYPISQMDLHQCADAVMQLKGMYLFKYKKFDQIHFNFLSDGKPRYFSDFADGDFSKEKFQKYLDYVFTYANTASLYRELVPVASIDEMQVGDVFIQTGKPFGHAVIVVDMARDTLSGQQFFMLAQSYMPAQETQILIHPESGASIPWYPLEEGVVKTPEWSFTSGDLRRFRQ